MTSISRTELQDAITRGTVVVVDALPAAPYRARHLPGALHLDADGAAEQAAGLLPGRAVTVVTYSTDSACGRGESLARTLRDLGYTDVRTYREGIADWVAAGLPVEGGEPAPRRAEPAVRVSIGVTNYSWPGGTGQLAATLAAVARDAEAAGVDTVWVADHLLQLEPGARIDEPMLEAYTTLGFLASATARVGLGTMVTWASIRPSALLVKAVTTLDVLSGGRAWLGLGAGYRDDEARMLGLPFPATAERFARLEETLRIARHLWDGRTEPFAGRFEQLEAPVSSPPPIRRPRILIGGTGEQRTLPLVARYADAANLFDLPDQGVTLRRKIDVLHRACAEIGRDPAGIELTVSSRLGAEETADAFTERCLGLRALGLQHVVLVGNGPWTGAALDTVGASIAQLTAAGPLT